MAVVAGVYVLQIAKCRSILLRERLKFAKAPSDAHWLACYWEVNGKRTQEVPSLIKILSGARPSSVNMLPRTARDMQDVKAAAWAIKVLGSLKEISIQDGGEEVMIFLRHVGTQPRLEDLFSFRAHSVTDELSRILPRFPNLRRIAIESTGFTGKGFPVLRELTDTDFSASPITVNGLHAIAACPKLKAIKIRDHPSPTRELREAAEQIMRERPGLEIW